MRGVTLGVIGAAVAVLLVIAILMRGGDDSPAPGTDIGVAPRPRAAGSGPAANAGGAGGGMNADSGEHNGRVADRLDQLRADYAKRTASGDNPAPGRREAPTVSAKAEKMRQQAERDLTTDDSDDDPEELAEARDTLQNNQDPDERIGAILMLTGDEGPESMRLLMETLDDPDAEVRLAAVEALGDRVEELTPGLLAKPLNDSDAEVRFEAVSALGDMDDPEALQLVKAALQDPDDDVRNLAQGILDFADADTNAPHAAVQPTAHK